MIDYSAFKNLSPTTLADELTQQQVMDIGIRPIWLGMPRVVGPAFTVRCSPGDNLMLHAAIYRASPGSILVVENGDLNFAVAGGNVCAVAQKRGIEAFIVDGVIRDLVEVRNIRFPVFARGVSPIPGSKNLIGELNGQIKCGNVKVNNGDIIVADEEGIVIVPAAQIKSILKKAEARVAKDVSIDLENWEKSHRAKIEEILRKKGYVG